MRFSYHPHPLIFLVSCEVKGNRLTVRCARRVSDFLSVLKRNVNAPNPRISAGPDHESVITADALVKGFNNVVVTVCEWLSYKSNHLTEEFERHYAEFVGSYDSPSPLMIVAGIQQLIPLITAIESKTLVTKLKLVKGDIIRFAWRSETVLSVTKLRTEPQLCWEMICLYPPPAVASKPSKRSTVSSTM